MTLRPHRMRHCDQGQFVMRSRDEKLACQLGCACGVLISKQSRRDLSQRSNPVACPAAGGKRPSRITRGSDLRAVSRITFCQAKFGKAEVRSLADRLLVERRCTGTITRPQQPFRPG